jgi:hypothetical protein
MQAVIALRKASLCSLDSFVRIACIGQQTANIALCDRIRVVLITETECVYCAVRSTLYVLPTQ